MGSKESDTTERLNTHAHMSLILQNLIFIKGCKGNYYCKGLNCLYPYWKQQKVRKNNFPSSYI